MYSTSKKSQFVKSTATQHGFDFCGIAKAEFLNDDAKKLENWLSKKYQAGMQYMENHFDKRVNPQLLVPGAKSVITVLKNYYPTKESGNKIKISKYAYGKDYHLVIKDNLKKYYADLQQHLGSFSARGFVDSAPVLERSWAVKSGLGWVGKNGNFITKQQGSFFFIATLIVDIELEYDNEFVKDYCGTCTKCIDECPTEAILPNKVIDASKCISYHTIELKDAFIANGLKGKFDNWMFGCDTCQDVCPWNRFSKPNSEQEFKPKTEIFNFNETDWLQLTEENFANLFKDSPLKRTKLQGIQRNIKFLTEENF